MVGPSCLGTLFTKHSTREQKVTNIARKLNANLRPNIGQNLHGVNIVPTQVTGMRKKNFPWNSAHTPQFRSQRGAYQGSHQSRGRGQKSRGFNKPKSGYVYLFSNRTFNHTPDTGKNSPPSDSIKNDHVRLSRPGGGPISVFSKKLEKTNKRSMDPRHNQRNKNRGHQPTSTGSGAILANFLSQGIHPISPRSARTSKQGGGGEDGVITRPVPRTFVFLKDQFLGHLFLIPQKDGSYRPVFNMKELNQFVQYEKLKMEGMPMLCTLLEKNDWMTKIDLKDAYFCLPIAHEHKKLFRFRWDNALFQFRVCPFGLASAPRIFTKILKPAMGFCRRLGIRLLIYLDDLIILNQNPENLTVDTNSIIWILQHLGFVINWNKSVPVPQQQLEYLGFTINSVALTLALPEDKVQNIRGKCQQLLPEKEVSARDLSKLIGKLTATVLAVLPAPLHFRQLQMLRTKALLQGSQNYGTKIELTSACRDELRWWIHYLNHWNGKSMVHSCPDLVITSDSSKVGWGAVCNQVTTQGQWNSDERQRHINALE